MLLFCEFVRVARVDALGNYICLVAAVRVFLAEAAVGRSDCRAVGKHDIAAIGSVGIRFDLGLGLTVEISVGNLDSIVALGAVFQVVVAAYPRYRALLSGRL